MRNLFCFIGMSFFSMLLFVPFTAHAHEAADIYINEIWAIPCEDTGNITSVFMTVDNTAVDHPVALIAGSSPVARHIHLVEGDGGCSEAMTERIVIPFGERVNFREDSYAISMEMNELHKAGEPFILTLTFDMLDDDFNSEGMTVDVVVGVPILEAPPSPSDILIITPWARPTAPGMMGDHDHTAEPPAFPAAAYMQLRNNGDAPERLVSAFSPVAGITEIHETQMQDDVMRMGAIDGLDLPPGETVRFEPGGYHIMLIELARDLFEGEAIPFTLTFESGTELTVAIPVYDLMMPEMSDAHDHSSHDHGSHDHSQQANGSMTLHFAAMVGDAPALCGETYPGIGADAAEISFNDFRFYVSNIHLLTAEGEAVPFQLEQDGLWQHENVALLDFENGTAGCSEIGNAAVNGIIIGEAPAGEYTGLRFDLGVPFELNHLDVTAAPSPLNIGAMWWSWQGGYKFIRVDLMTDATESEPAWNIHIGSTGCASPAGVIPPAEACARPNIATITFDAFDFDQNIIIADLGGLLQDIALYENTPMPPGCMSGVDDPDCPALFFNFGLSLDSGICTDADCAAQTFFHVGDADTVMLIGRIGMNGMDEMNGDHDHDHDHH